MGKLTHWPNCQSSKSPISQLTNLPTLQLANSILPIGQLTDQPNHQFSNSPIGQLYDFLSYQLASSPINHLTNGQMNNFLLYQKIKVTTDRLAAWPTYSLQNG
jgi:hypothetical protein